MEVLARAARLQRESIETDPHCRTIIHLCEIVVHGDVQLHVRAHVHPFLTDIGTMTILKDPGDTAQNSTEAEVEVEVRNVSAETTPKIIVA